MLYWVYISLKQYHEFSQRPVVKIKMAAGECTKKREYDAMSPGTDSDEDAYGGQAT